MGTWFHEHGHLVTRLGLPDVDLAIHSQVVQVVKDMTDVLCQGEQVFLWISLPCAPWCRWQTVNGGLVASPERCRQLQLQRELSLKMVRESDLGYQGDLL